ncbi:MAG: hypothetical protein GY703_16760 [Gammaproteobacteria bacterium]|nr:hypothetical protein [Gammaproteobacteria bacterium]
MSGKHLGNHEVEFVEEAEVKDIPPPRQGVPGSSKPAILLALLALVIAVGVLLFGYQHWRSMRATLERVDLAVEQATRQQRDLENKLNLAVQTFESQQTILQSEKQLYLEQQQLFSAQESQLSQERTRLKEQSIRIQETLGAIHHRLASNSADWMVVEAEYLLQIANHRLQLEKDIPTALLALKNADDRLRESGDPAWIAIREMIAGETAALKAVNQIDVAGLSSRLSGLVKQVKSLHFDIAQPSPAVPDTPEKDIEAAKRDRSFETLLDDGWNALKSVLVVRHHGQPVTAMLSPEQQYFVYQNLRLQLEAARMALLRRDQALYLSSLQTTEQWIEDFFDPTDPVVRAMTEELSKLKQVEINPELPNISGSLLVLRERLERISGGNKE